MGQNSKARRDARAKVRRKAQRAAERGPGRAPATHVHRLEDDELRLFDGSDRSVAQLFRRACSECGSSDLEWMTPGELADRDDQARAARVAEGVEFLGGASDAWLCRTCGNFGLM
ncbi:hypothetical protein [Cellulosimicrobium cellulans]|uniref:hypothetical protein n=1 Tax=Cellulosimicrobium cellulans TaxID=1710 RepID=UPI00130EC569|nr:hypothetical protein [Cellulosimicrobium cellulans]